MLMSGVDWPLLIAVQQLLVLQPTFMNGKDFGEVINIIRKEDARYEKGAYYFVRKALDHTLKQVYEKEGERDSRHVDGRELLEGIKEYALEQFGPMAHTVFLEWGLTSSRDFGEIVFNLVDYGVFGKTDSDSRDDFNEGLDFYNDLVVPFLPASKLKEEEKTVKKKTARRQTVKRAKGNKETPEE